MPNNFQKRSFLTLLDYTPEEIAAWLPGNRADVRGLWTKWIVLAALLQGDRIFETVHKI